MWRRLHLPIVRHVRADAESRARFGALVAQLRLSLGDRFGSALEGVGGFPLDPRHEVEFART